MIRLARFLVSSCLVVCFGTISVLAQNFQRRQVDSIRASFEDARGNDIACADADHCVYVGNINNGTMVVAYIRATTDGGETWRRVWSDSFSIENQRIIHPERIAHPTPNVILMAADDAYLFRSSDGGKSWTETQIGDAQFPLRSLEMYDARTGVVINRSTVYRTSDSGVTWQPLSLPDEWGDHSTDYVFPLGPRSLIVRGGMPGSVMVGRTDNDGETWQLSPGPWTAARMSFPDPLHGWAVGLERDSGGLFVGKDVIARTTDGGLTWHDQIREKVDPPYGLANVDFFDSLNGVAGSVDKIVVTTDGGENWQYLPISQEGSNTIRGVSYPAANLVFAVTGNSTVFTLERISTFVNEDNQEKEASVEVYVRDRRLWITPRRLAGQRALLVLYDAVGREVMRDRVEGRTPKSFPINDLPSGLYVVVIESGGVLLASEKLLISE